MAHTKKKFFIREMSGGCARFWGRSHIIGAFAAKHAVTRVIATVMVFALAFTFTGCTNSQDTGKETGTEADISTTQESQNLPTEEETTVPDTEESTTEEAQPAEYRLEDYPLYMDKVSQYRDAIISGASYDEELNIAVPQNGEGDYMYALEDIDGNGIPELIFQFTQGETLIDLYSIDQNNNTIVQLVGIFYVDVREWLGIFPDGLIQISGSSGIFSGGTELFQINPDGVSVSFIGGQYTVPNEYNTEATEEYKNYEAYTAALERVKGKSVTFRWHDVIQ